MENASPESKLVKSIIFPPLGNRFRRFESRPRIDPIASKSGRKGEGNDAILYFHHLEIRGHAFDTSMVLSRKKRSFLIFFLRDRSSHRAKSGHSNKSRVQLYLTPVIFFHPGHWTIKSKFTALLFIMAYIARKSYPIEGWVPQ